jgi:uncharacterized SAM-binding protein YcdF (DUF218 family)
MSAGVAETRVQIVPLQEAGTYGESLAVRRWAVGRQGIKRVLVVTSPYHTRRSLATFRAVLEPVHIEVGVAPATASSPAKPGSWWLSPYDRAYVCYEWAGMLYYGARRRLS